MNKFSTYQKFCLFLRHNKKVPSINMTFDEEFENVKNIVGMCLKSLVGHRAQEYRAVLGRAPEAGLFRPRIWLVWNTFKTMLV